MLVIRFTRTGKKGERKFRLVVKERRSKRDGKPVDLLGYYEKTVSGITKKFDDAKIKYWVSQGAQMTPAVKDAIENVKREKKI
ncbi:MAG: 30S ribosomal protein S16, partial [Candidatus Levybacteria bacterium]|nr:30S ribosomal protein S16 [Candidatus Levybacteria bacterium]